MVKFYEQLSLSKRICLQVQLELGFREAAIAASLKRSAATISRVLDRIDAQKCLCITCDRGKEMALHEQLTGKTCVKACFADPHAPGQHGINKNTNGMIRQYLPEGEDLSQ